MIKVKRIYETPARNDGVRILVDRIWPRRLSKEDAMVDVWLREVAPSKELRQWFDHDEAKWKEFKQRYQQELANVLPLIRPFISFLEEDHGTVTLLFAAKNEGRNNAVALCELLKRSSKK